MGIDWSLREGYAWAEDKEHCEEYGRMLNADPGKVSMRAKKRGLPQLGTLGAGNHYLEVQVRSRRFLLGVGCLLLLVLLRSNLHLLMSCSCMVRAGGG